MSALPNGCSPLAATPPEGFPRGSAVPCPGKFPGWHRVGESVEGPLRAMSRHGPRRPAGAAIQRALAGRRGLPLTYPVTVPVSRKRKKTRKSSRVSKPQKHVVLRAGPDDGPLDLAAAMAGFGEYRRQLDERRASLAAAVAEPMIAELIGLAATRSGSELEDELCVRIGRVLAELDDAPIDDHVGPNTFAEAVINAAVKAVGVALAGEADRWTHAWRVLATVRDIVNYPLSEQATESIVDLRARPGGHLLPDTPIGPTVVGPVLWTRDAYGSRFGVTAPFRTGDGPDRWYLWDIDACGHEAFTVHSRYHATPEEALADWQAGVGTPAADGAVFAPVDDPVLLDDLMPREQGMIRPGGESVEQFAEYHRSRRLAEAVIDVVVPAGPPRAPLPADLDRTTAVALFAAWLREHRPDRSLPVDLDELITELADSWQVGGPEGVYHTCSPHRVALTVEHIRGYYQDDFAADLIALLPAWAAWLADRNATPAYLADRCGPYAHGEPHKAVSTDDGRLDCLARITE